MDVLKQSQKLTVTEFAKLIGVSSTAVSHAISKGRMPLSVEEGSNGKKLIDAKIGVEEFNQNKKRGAVNFSEKKGRRTVDASEAADSEKKLKHYKAELARIEVEEAENRLVDAEKVKRQAFKISRAVRDAMLNIPDRLSAELAAEKDQFNIHQRLTSEIRLALESLSAEIISDDEVTETDNIQENEGETS
jgi:predicted transcriptional regulator